MACDWVWRIDGYYAKISSSSQKRFNRQGDVRANNIKIRAEVCLKIEPKYTCVVVLKLM